MNGDYNAFSSINDVDVRTLMSNSCSVLFRQFSVTKNVSHNQLLLGTGAIITTYGVSSATELVLAHSCKHN